MTVSFIDSLSAGLPDDVKAILDVAYLRNAMGDAAFERVLSTFAKGYQAAIRRIADDLHAAEDFRSDDPSAQVLARYGIRAVGLLDRVVCAHAEEKEHDAIQAARDVADLRAQRPVKRVA